jgi:transcriptional regulator with XRE-family HTH domain
MGHMDHIGKNIKLLRQKHNWNQSQVAKQLKISTPAFSKIETGITDVNYSRLDQIAKIFEVPVTALLAHDKDNLQSKRQEELDTLTTKLNKREEEIIKLQSLLIELYEEVRKK